MRKVMRYPLAEEFAALADTLEMRAHRKERGTIDRRLLERASLGVRRLAKSIQIEHDMPLRREARRRRENRDRNPYSA
jgi:hypothetical protein